MKNAWIDTLKSTVVLKITGKNIDRFVQKLVMKKIELLKIEPNSYREIHIKVYKEDYEKVLALKTIYEVSITKTYGILKIKKMIKFHRIFIFFIVVGLSILYLLSNIISKVEIVHANYKVRELLYEELSFYGIEKNHFRKSYFNIQKIKKKILEKHKDQIEWLEIENIGTKYKVRIEVRKLPKKEKEKEMEDVVAKKAAIIRKIESKSGVIVKNVNDYVEKGTIIISGNVLLNEELKETIGAGGTIYGEVWYKVKITYPYFYYEENITNQKNTVYTLKFINKRWELFNRKSYQDKKIQSQTLLKNNVIPISFVKEKQTKINVIRQRYTEKEALKKAKEVAHKRIQKNLGEKERILDEKKLKVTAKDSKIEVEMFFTVYENITATQPVEKIEPKIEIKEE